MRIYVASKFENQDKVQEIYKKLRKNGYKIIYDWTKHEPIKPYKENPEKARDLSEKEVVAVKDADVFILLTTEKVDRGMHVEFGTAIISNLLTGKPRIFVLGEFNDRSTFYFHSTVNRVGTIEDVIEELRK
ncbi:MAG: hypothetical protein GF368_04950 [Candidatus Aenigmarchaeota archaeon]|nr:hypothetical protein [Candidatus Aenigmarchaeota archaeon]